MRIGFLLLILTASTAGASPYAGVGAAGTFNSGHPSLMAGYRTDWWRGEIGTNLFDRRQGKSAASGTLGTTITAERFDLRTRLFYSDLSLRLHRKDTHQPSGLEIGIGMALMRVAKDIRIERNSGLGELYSHDVVWRGLPMLRLAFVKPAKGKIELGLDARYVMSGDAHGGKDVGGWWFFLTARFHPLIAN